MSRQSLGLLPVCLVLSACACSSHATETAPVAGDAPHTTVSTPARVADAAVSGMPHGDHNPRHGGVVYMYDDMHYEVVLVQNGHHAVYFSDASREDLPASVASSVTLTVERPGSDPESLVGAIDEAGESWRLAGRPVSDPRTSVRVAFTAKGGQYWIDVPFIPPAP